IGLEAQLRRGHALQPPVGLAQQGLLEGPGAEQGDGADDRHEIEKGLATNAHDAASYRCDVTPSNGASAATGNGSSSLLLPIAADRAPEFPPFGVAATHNLEPGRALDGHRRHTQSSKSVQ